MNLPPSLGPATRRAFALAVVCALFAGSGAGSAGATASIEGEPRTSPAVAAETEPIPPARTLVCKLPRGAGKLPASSRRGLIQHLHQYPDVGLATRGERARARRILAELVAAAREGDWRDLRAAEEAGYDTRTRVRKPGDRRVFFFHAERGQQPRGRSIFDFSRPKALIYANAPGRPLVLVGAMWSTRDGELGPTPAGPIMRWHSHTVCAAPGKRGLKPPPGGACPPGTRLIQGRSEMLHVWFTRDLRSAFAISAPQPELCAAGLLPDGHCRSID